MRHQKDQSKNIEFYWIFSIFEEQNRVSIINKNNTFAMDFGFLDLVTFFFSKGIGRKGVHLPLDTQILYRFVGPLLQCLLRFDHRRVDFSQNLPFISKSP